MAASRTPMITSSIGSTAASLARGSTGARSRVTKDTSASGSAPGSSVAAAPPGASASASIFCGLNGGMLAESSVSDSDRLPATRTNGRTRTSSRLPTWVVVLTRMTWRWELISPAGGSRSLLREPASVIGRRCRRRRAARPRPAPARSRNWSRRRATRKRRRPSGPRRKGRSGSCR